MGSKPNNGLNNYFISSTKKLTIIRHLFNHRIHRCPKDIILVYNFFWIIKK